MEFKQWIDSVEHELDHFARLELVSASILAALIIEIRFLYAKTIKIVPTAHRNTPIINTNTFSGYTQPLPKSYSILINYLILVAIT